MCAGRYLAVLLLVCYALFSTPLFAQENSGWRISPENINIQMGTDRPLQLLDDSAQELDEAAWAVDNPDLAEIQVEDGITVLHPKAVGTVVVTATLGETAAYWPEDQRDRRIVQGLIPSGFNPPSC